MLPSEVQLNTSSNPMQQERTGQRAGPTTNICTGEYSLVKEVNRNIQMRGEERSGPTELHTPGI